MRLIIFLLIGTAFMFLPISYISKRNGYPLWKGAIISVVLTLIGTLGTLIMYYIENGEFKGISFFGAVFFVPIVFALLPFVFRIPYKTLMDMCAMGECLMLVIMKIHCILSGCCKGRMIGNFRFPSRAIEMTASLVIFTILFLWYRRSKNHGVLYAYYLVIYGAVRFGLNFMRDIPIGEKMPLPFGNIWSIVAMAIGGAWILISYYKKIDRDYKALKEEQ